MPEPEGPLRRRGGRSARVQEQVETAALRILLDVGYAGLTIRGVAQAAGVAETTVYRRWPTLDDLAAAALMRLAEVDNPTPDTGSLDGDLRALLDQIVDLLERPELLRVIRSSIVADSESAAQARRAFFTVRFGTAAEIIDRAIGRGELPTTADSDLMIEALVAPAYMRAVFGHRPIDAACKEASIASALATAD